MFAVPLRDIVRISPSAGTTAKPFVVGFTRGDLKAREAITARFLSAGGTTDTDIVQICLNPGLAGWGRALKEAAEYIGASVMPMTQMSTSKQLMAMKDYRTSVLITTPSYAMHMLGVMNTFSVLCVVTFVLPSLYAFADVRCIRITGPDPSQYLPTLQVPSVVFSDCSWIHGCAFLQLEVVLVRL